MASLQTAHVWCDFISNKLDLATRRVCIFLILFMTVEVIVAVFFRYCLDDPIRWAEELARLAMVWAGLLGISIALKDGEHVGLEILYSRLPRRARGWCDLVAHGLLIPFLVILLLWGIQISRAAWGSVLPALQIDWTWSHIAVPLTAGIQLVHTLSKMLHDLLQISEGDSHTLNPTA